MGGGSGTGDRASLGRYLHDSMYIHGGLPSLHCLQTPLSHTKPYQTHTCIYTLTEKISDRNPLPCLYTRVLIFSIGGRAFESGISWESSNLAVYADVVYHTKTHVKHSHSHNSLFLCHYCSIIWSPKPG